MAEALKTLLSPTSTAKAGFKSIFDFDDLVEYIAAPATVAVPEDARAAGAVLFNAVRGNHERLLSETDPVCRGLLSMHLPGWVELLGHPGGDTNAAALWGGAAACTSAWRLPMACIPDVPARAAPPPGAGAVVVGASNPPRVPSFAGEGKSVAKTMWTQVVLYTTMDMTAIFFPAADGKPGARVFYDKPPIGYAVLGYPVVGHYLAVEWVGKLLVSVASQPFYLGTAAHATAMGALPKPTYGEPAPLPSEENWVQAPGAQWKVDGGRFYKLVAAARRSGEQFAAMHAVYTHLAELENDGTCPRAALLALTARAAYGAHEVLVTMDAFDGAVCDDADLMNGGSIQDAVAAAVAWLAFNRVVYVDIRGPNVLKRAGGGADDVRLVDFDDALLSPEAITTYAAYMHALAAADAKNSAHLCFGVVDGRTFAARVLNLGDESMNAIRAALQRAFAERAPAGAAAT